MKPSTYVYLAAYFGLTTAAPWNNKRDTNTCPCAPDGKPSTSTSTITQWSTQTRTHTITEHVTHYMTTTAAGTAVPSVQTDAAASSAPIGGNYGGASPSSVSDVDATGIPTNAAPGSSGAITSLPTGSFGEGNYSPSTPASSANVPAVTGTTTMGASGPEVVYLATQLVRVVLPLF
ncbi:hypothetical protein M436DRAFT_77161 [Aureobasidium namibiae CBS 147.97]|uniref:Uncharacterized protein n=1 Tax=Aureobasidium namibiae CBS 147.97 TaxID=1043004 RepID=A0A074W4J7_9PEZI|nr:uncharacterized protein M436DRAFT_77161 [Aureobasidium namibiae CBS 147.97]KEQ68055.1 hypothetical protein M436DRAFT_77161 [Aureobasidium namibiae CBS 147.97]